MNVESANLNDIAVIGFAGRFPGAKNVDEFWANLCRGIESVTCFTDEDLLREGLERSILDDPAYVKAKAILEQVEYFDAAFFGMSPREAEITDPQHRFFLESAWEALEHAGYNPDAYEGAVGIYAGAGTNRYLANLYSAPELVEDLGTFRALIGNASDHLTTFASYKLNLTGPSINVQTACSTSLVAVHLACQGLIGGECDVAIAGGVSIDVPQRTGQFYREGGIVSPDGHCRAFDARAQGTVGGSGVAVLVLKRFADALEEGDTVYAVIKGSAINNDGAVKVGYTAPSAAGQARVIAEAQRVAGIDPATITYIEAHGTGTALGDPIEVEALATAFGVSAQHTPCALGAVKTNVGHLDTASGAAGLIKTVLAIKHGLLPPTLHYENPNPGINFAATGFYVNTQLKSWDTGDMPRRAGVSSFGIGGTNAHVVLEQAPELPPSEPAGVWQLVSISGRTDSALKTSAAQLRRHLQQNRGIDLADAAYTLHVGRKHFAHRCAVLAANAEQAIAGLEKIHSGGGATECRDLSHRPVVFMFPGQGAQYPGMGEELYLNEATFRAEMDHCFEVLAHCHCANLKEVLFASTRDPGNHGHDLNHTEFAQPALFAVEYAMARLWMSWGIHPEAMIGHSLGEYTAACLAGVFSLEEGLELVTERARLMQRLPPGAMLAVGLSENELLKIVPAELSLAAINSPEQCVVSGPFEAIESFRALLDRKRMFCRTLRTSHAFHSAMVEPMLDSFAERISKIRLMAPKVPFLSNLTGTWISAEQAQSPDYWVQHLRKSVRFLDGVRELAKEPARIFLEVGPGRNLSALMATSEANPARPPAVASFGPAGGGTSEWQGVLRSLGELWCAGVPVAWPRFYAGQKRRRIPLPTYPFERKRYWIEAEPQHQSRAAQASTIRRHREAGPVEPDRASERPDEVSDLERVVSAQLQIMSEQLQLLSSEPRTD